MTYLLVTHAVLFFICFVWTLYDEYRLNDQTIKLYGLFICWLGASLPVINLIGIVMLAHKYCPKLPNYVLYKKKL